MIDKIIEPITNTVKRWIGYKKIVVLGMPEAGKTTFLCHLREKPYVNEGTSTDPYESFSVKLENGRMFIDRGVDIGGGESYLSQYPQLINDADIVFFIFNANLYLTNDEYKNKTNVRFDFVYRHIGETKCCIIGSHSDVYRLNNSNNPIEAIRNMVFDENEYPKKYKELLNTNFVCTNLTDEKSVKKILSKFK